MPPQHAQGDVLDRALAVARSKAPAHVAANPNLTKPQAGFFGAVAGKRSPLNTQSSRLTHPFASNPFLGGGNVGTVATPAQQAFIAKGAASAGSKPAQTIEQNYVKGADTQKVIPARSKPGVRGGPMGVQGAALTAPDLGAVGTRALGLLGSNIPLGSAAPLALKALSSIGLTPDARQQVIQGFSQDASLAAPQSKAALVALALAKGHSIPANPTSRQLLTAALEPNQHKSSYWDAVDPANILKDAVYTPAYAFEGGYALGHAGREALPTAVGGKGDLSGLKAIGEQQLNTLEHPGAYVQQHPFQAGLAVLTGLKGVGGLAGKAADLPQAVRAVETPEGFTLNRGTLSKNLTERAGQKASDALLARSPRLQRSEIGKQVRTIHARSVQAGERAAEANVKPFLDARSGLGRTERNSLLFNQGAGGGAVPEEFAASYEGKAAAFKAAGKRSLPKTQTAQANLRRAESERFGNAPLEPAQQAYVDAARTAATNRTQTMQDLGVLDPVSAKWRDAEHLIDLRASQGDAIGASARRVEKARSDYIAAEKGSPEQEQASRVLNGALDSFLAKHAESGGQQPFRVPTKKPKPLSDFVRPGRNVRANKELKSMITGAGKQSKGEAVTSGNYAHSEAEFVRQLMQPHTAAATADFVDKVRDSVGRPAIPGEEIPEGTVLRSNTNIRATPKVTVTAENELNQEADALRGIRDQFRDPAKEDSLTHVPQGYNGTIYPRAVLDHIDDLVKRADTKHTGIADATRAYKGAILYSRPAYAAGNFANSMGQALLGGTGPLSLARKGALAKPLGVSDNSFAARVLDEPKGSLGGALDNARFSPTIAGKIGQTVKGGAQALDSAYRGSVRKASVWSDNVWRDALYTRHALPEARKLAYPEDGAIKRLLVRKRASDEAVQDAAKAMAEGTTQEAREARDRALTKTFDFLGDFAAMKHYKALDLAVPFNIWTRFSAKLLLKTLPLKYPGRTALVYRIGQLGQQASGQQGVLPQYLQESIPFGGTNPLNQGEINTQRANSLATLGQIAPLDDTGKAGTEQWLGNLSPFLAPLIEASTGNDLQTGTAIKDAQGNPIKANPGDIARFLGAQAAGFVPPVGLASSLFEHGKKPAATSIPFVGFQGKHPNAQGPLLQQPPQPGWETIANMLAPVRFSQRNQHADQYYGNADLRTALAKAQEDDNKKALGKPGGQAAVVAKWKKIGDEVNKRYAYYVANPGALKKLVANGVPAAANRGTGSRP